MKQFFKNAIIYKLTEGALDPDVIEPAIEQHQHTPPLSLDVSRYGFIPPMDGQLVETVMGITMLAARHSWRDLPSSVIKEMVEEKAKAISEAESRSVGRKERQEIKDSVIFELLPKAFIKHRTTYAITFGEYLIVDSGSAKEAESFCSALREAMGSLRCIPLGVENSVTQVMTSWITSGTKSARLQLGESCNLAGAKDGRTIRCRNQDLSADEFINHVNSGLYVEQISVDLKDSINFTINDQLHIKRIIFNDLLHDRINDENAETKRELCIAGMLITAEVIRDLIDHIYAEFGAEAQS